jgi:cytochrome c oxidase accessory protein FixG
VEQHNKNEEFRDKIATVDASGKRIWVYPKKPSGEFYRWRSWLSYLLLFVLFTGPFLRIDGQPLLMLNVLERKFVILGQVFWPQDFYLFALGFITFIVFIILFTVVYGRLFCGWVCPQTIFLEMLFRKIEYAIEGDWTAQKKLDRQTWNREKIVKKGSKHLIFFLISFLIANTFLAYIIGSEELLEIITDPPAQHLAGLGAIILFTLVFYWVFARFREQVCTTVCPYGRLQGVLLDRKSTVISYDYKRGEPRGKFRKKEDRSAVGKGDCIDCKQCVYVCPTGIDIRNGTQLECVNCTACIDACNNIMDQVGLPRDLIRYASEKGIAKETGEKGFRMDTRSVAYTVVLALLLLVLSGMLFLRTNVDATILRTPGVMYQTLEGGQISNLYQYKFINKTADSLFIHLSLIEEPQGTLEVVGGSNQIIIASQGVAEGALFIKLPAASLQSISQEVKVGIYNSEDKLIKELDTRFLGPGTR